VSDANDEMRCGGNRPAQIYPVTGARDGALRPDDVNGRRPICPLGPEYRSRRLQPRKVHPMWSSIVLDFLAGILFGNGIPHFVRGITRENYPCMLGNSPVPNLIAGWLSFVLVGILARWIDLEAHRDASLAAASLGVLAIGLFHASIGAFGRRS
jgi:hypothetical protein